MKLSRASTRTPLASNASHRCEPMKPAPPETTALGLFAANAAIREAQALHQNRVVDVATVDDHRTAHQLLDARHVQLPELVPLGDPDERVSPFRPLICILEILEFAAQHPLSLDPRAIIGTTAARPGHHTPRDVQA